MKPASHRYLGIQALRFVAAMLVVLIHSTFYVRERLDSSVTVWGLGVIGVDIFFVISGFVVIQAVRPLIGRPRAVRTFLLSRVVRIVPIYWLVTSVKIAALVAVPAAVFHAQLTATGVVSSYLFLPTYNADGDIQPIHGVGWTLTLEVAFYGVVALALFARLPLVRSVAAVIFACAALGLVISSHIGAWSLYFEPIILYFAIGLGIGRLVESRVGRRIGLVIAAALLAVSLGTFLLDGSLDAIEERTPLRFGLVGALVLAVVLAEPFLAGRLPRWLLAAGNSSYALYLLHPLVAPAVPSMLARIGTADGRVAVLGCVIVSVAAGALVHTFVEKPLTARLRRLTRLRAAAGAAGGSADRSAGSALPGRTPPAPGTATLSAEPTDATSHGGVEGSGEQHAGGAAEFDLQDGRARHPRGVERQH